MRGPGPARAARPALGSAAASLRAGRPRPAPSDEVAVGRRL